MLHEDSLLEMVQASNTPVVDPDRDITMLAVDRGSTAEYGAIVNRGSRRSDTELTRGSRRCDSGVTRGGGGENIEIILREQGEGGDAESHDLPDNGPNFDDMETEVEPDNEISDKINNCNKNGFST